MFRWITPENSSDLLPQPRRSRDDGLAPETVPWPLPSARARPDDTAGPTGVRLRKTGPDRTLEVSALRDLGLSPQEIARYLGLALQEVASLLSADLDLAASLANNMTPVYRTRANAMRWVG
ncbi:hypothetical protein B6V74_09875 [Thioclava sp. F42-5]|uniref:hypothetical protein n=1 Tax=Thioclava sp. F42-5 TaxID=1973005 RepID=UPI000B53C453|nr:hypothetical protein [Thioclava sp. F42-5]OWY08957.1 hypothetical protein B6V74_09875 [Thioclava sp. F42-5]